ncbi:MAG: hypothetical protein OEY41_18380 [Acidimicrobiia bacterium]|nr:hypothetical protein [Acidimicrobiia bacterium]MDH4362898.1 hypothetical protein [Acidimicrobiia bacterium]MDH5291969.1 hypothetical protein [Acidimicrobiia bacterium]
MTTAEPEPPARLLQRQPWPFHHCPSCGHEEFEVLCLTGHVVFSCQGCSRVWRFVLGYLQELPARVGGVGIGPAVGARAEVSDTPTATMALAEHG